MFFAIEKQGWELSKLNVESVMLLWLKDLEVDFRLSANPYYFFIELRDVMDDLRANDIPSFYSYSRTEK